MPHPAACDGWAAQGKWCGHTLALVVPRPVGPHFRCHLLCSQWIDSYLSPPAAETQTPAGKPSARTDDGERSTSADTSSCTEDTGMTDAETMPKQFPGCSANERLLMDECSSLRVALRSEKVRVLALAVWMYRKANVQASRLELQMHLEDLQAKLERLQSATGTSIVLAPQL